MTFRSFFAELKRRNVYKVAIAYLGACPIQSVMLNVPNSEK